MVLKLFACYALFSCQLDLFLYPSRPAGRIPIVVVFAKCSGFCYYAKMFFFFLLFFGLLKNTIAKTYHEIEEFGGKIS